MTNDEALCKRIDGVEENQALQAQALAKLIIEQLTLEGLVAQLSEHVVINRKELLKLLGQDEL